MSDAYTSNLNLVKPAVGGSVDTWGTKISNNLDTLDTIFSANGTEINARFNSANFDDNKKALFGTGDDLEIYHDGSNSIIKDSGTGNLTLLATNLSIKNAGDSENYLTANDGGDLILYKAGTEKARTSTNGFNVTGDIAVTGTVDGVDVSGLNTTVSNLSSSLSTVATSGSYNDLSNTPTVPTNNNQLTNGAGYTTYTSNQATDTTSAVSFSGVSINGNYDLTLNTGNWTGEKSAKIQHHSSNLYLQYNSNLIGRNSSGSNMFNLDSSGNATFNANVTAYSDFRIKEDIKTIDNALDKVCKLRGVEYTRKETKAREIGVIAQEVKEIVPELVNIENTKSDINPEGLEDLHTMKYQNTVGLLIEAIKELKDEIKELRGV